MASVNRADVSMPHKGLDHVQTKSVKATLRGQSSSIRLTEVVKAALVRHYGSLKAAAITLGMDLGQLSRELESGDFKLLKRLDGVEHAEARQFVIEAMREAEGSADPKAQARRLIREARQRLDELAEVVA